MKNYPITSIMRGKYALGLQHSNAQWRVIRFGKKRFFGLSLKQSQEVIDRTKTLPIYLPTAGMTFVKGGWLRWVM